MGQGKVLGAGKPFVGKENSRSKGKETHLDNGKTLLEKGKPLGARKHFRERKNFWARKTSWIKGNLSGQGNPFGQGILSSFQASCRNASLGWRCRAAKCRIPYLFRPQRAWNVKILNMHRPSWDIYLGARYEMLGISLLGTTASRP